MKTSLLVALSSMVLAGGALWACSSNDPGSGLPTSSKLRRDVERVGGAEAAQARAAGAAPARAAARARAPAAGSSSRSSSGSGSGSSSGSSSSSSGGGTDAGTDSGEDGGGAGGFLSVCTTAGGTGAAAGCPNASFPDCQMIMMANGCTTTCTVATQATDCPSGATCNNNGYRG